MKQAFEQIEKDSRRKRRPLRRHDGWRSGFS